MNTTFAAMVVTFFCLLSPHARALEPRSSIVDPISPPPAVAVDKPIYFGVRTFVVHDSTLILIADRQECSQFLSRHVRHHYMLNGKPDGVVCDGANVIGIQNFFLAILVR